MISHPKAEDAMACSLANLMAGGEPRIHEGAEALLRSSE